MPPPPRLLARWCQRTLCKKHKDNGLKGAKKLKEERAKTQAALQAANAKAAAKSRGRAKQPRIGAADSDAGANKTAGEGVKQGLHPPPLHPPSTAPTLRVFFPPASSCSRRMWSCRSSLLAKATRSQPWGHGKCDAW